MDYSLTQAVPSKSLNKGEGECVCEGGGGVRKFPARRGLKTWMRIVQDPNAPYAQIYEFLKNSDLKE